jgi:hypothetical protein
MPGGAWILTAFVVGLFGCQRAAPSPGPSSAERRAVELAAPDAPAVELVIDYGDGSEKRFTRIPYQDGMTVLVALRLVAKHPRGITFDSSGSGSSALLTRIDDLGNEATPDGKNWLYRVGGKLADKSCGAYVLSPGDVILWRFEKSE